MGNKYSPIIVGLILAISLANATAVSAGPFDPPTILNITHSPTTIWANLTSFSIDVFAEYPLSPGSLVIYVNGVPSTSNSHVPFTSCYNTSRSGQPADPFNVTRCTAYGIKYSQPGTYSYYANATNWEGNVSAISSPASSFTVLENNQQNNTLPWVNLTSPPNNAVLNNSQPNHEFYVKDNENATLSYCRLNYMLNETPFTRYQTFLYTNATYTITNDTIHSIMQNQSIADGIYKWFVDCSDNMGNQDSETLQLTIFVNGDGPNMAIGGPSSAPEGDPVTLTANASDYFGVSQIDIYTDGGLLPVKTCLGVTSCDYTTTYTAGTHTYGARATDGYGQQTENLNAGTINVNAADTTPPTVFVTAPSVVGVGETFKISAIASDDIQAVNLVIYVDNSSVSELCLQYLNGTLNCTHTANYATSGNHTYYATASDTSGNTATTPTQTFYVNAPPVVTATHSPENITEGQQVTINATATDEVDVSELIIYLDGTALQVPCAKISGTATVALTPAPPGEETPPTPAPSGTAMICTYATSSLAVGNHSYYATATDNNMETARDPVSGNKTIVVAPLGGGSPDPSGGGGSSSSSSGGGGSSSATANVATPKTQSKPAPTLAQNPAGSGNPNPAPISFTPATQDGITESSGNKNSDVKGLAPTGFISLVAGASNSLAIIGTLVVMLILGTLYYPKIKR